MSNKITKHEIETLRIIAALGGVWTQHTHNGRKRAGTIRTNTARRLHDRGLLVCEDVIDPERVARFAHVERAVLTSTKFFLTAAGCVALHEAD